MASAHRTGGADNPRRVIGSLASEVGVIVPSWRRPAPNPRFRRSRRRLQAGAKGARALGTPVEVLPFPAGAPRAWVAGPPPREGAPDDQAEIVQAPRPRADGEDGRELLGGAGHAAARGGAEGHLDECGAAERPHPEIPRWLSEERGVDGWDAQSVTVGYERASGRRAVGEHAEGFAITASKTVAVPVDRLYEAFVDESLRERWLPGGALRERTSSRPKSARFDWGDGSTRVLVGFTSKGDARSTLALAHERLPDAEEAERMKAFWRDRVAALKEL